VEEMNKSEQLIACLEGEIAKRDEELAACRVAVDNCEVFRARIVELEARIVWLECEAQVNASPAAPAADALLVEALDYQVLFDAIAAATSVYANGAVNISVQAFRDALAAHRAKGVV
jgi:hypothetical protein